MEEERIYLSAFTKADTYKSVTAVADQAVVSATSFFTGVIIGRVCTKEQFGLYMLGLSIVLFFTDIQSSLILSPYMIYSPRLSGKGLRQYNGSSLIHQFWLSTLTIVLLIIGQFIVSLGIGPEGLSLVIWALIITVTFILMKDYARRICFARLRLKSALVLDLFVFVLQICLLLILAYLGILSARLSLFAIGAASGIAALFWFILNIKDFILRPNLAVLEFRQSWSLGKWILASGILYAISASLYPWILAAFHGTQSVGIWAACVGIVALGNPILLGLQNYLGPKISDVYANLGASELRRFLFRANIAFTIVTLSFCFLLLIFGGKLLVAFYGRKYSGNVLVVSAFAMNLVASALGFSFSRALFVLERADVDFKVNFVALFVLMTLGIWLVKAFGPLGAAVGLLITYSISSVVRYAAFIKLVSFKTKK